MAISTVMSLFALLTSLNFNLPLVEMLLFEEEPSAEDSPVQANGLVEVTSDPGEVSLAPRNILNQ